MRNPFIYGESVTGKDFCNRDQEVKDLKNDMLDCQKIFLVSPRRMGKTSLIRMVLHRIDPGEMISVFLDIEGFSSYKEFLDAYLSLLIRKSTPKNRILQVVKQVASGLRIDLKIDETGLPSISLGYKNPVSSDVDSTIFGLPEVIAEKQDKK